MLPPGLKFALPALSDPGILGGRAYLVGGSVRDLLLGRTTKDLDVALEGDPIPGGRRLANELGGSFVLLHEETSTVRVVVRYEGEWWWIDLVPLPGTLEQDLRRRDFTINAMAVPLAGGEIALSEVIDPTGGLQDLKRRQIRQASANSFPDDPLRVLRAFRLQTILQFEIEPQTLAAIQEHAELIRGVSRERIRDEIFTLLEAPYGSQGLQALDEAGLLSILFPELIPLHGCIQNQNHHRDVWGHTLEAVSNMDRLAVAEVFGAELAPLLEEYLAEPITRPRSRRALLKFALLFHDITKPETRTEDEGRVRFVGHEQSSAEVAARIARRYKLSTREVGVLKAAIGHHLQPGYMTHLHPLTPRAVHRFFRELNGAVPEALVLSYADRMAARGPSTTPRDFEAHRALAARLLREYFERLKCPLPPLLSGYEIIRELGIEPGPQVGELLEELAEAQAAGEISTRAEALEHLRRFLSDRALSK